MSRILSLSVLPLLIAVPAVGADFVWTTAEVKATRFEAADSKELATVESGKRVEVLFRDGERLRIKLPASSQFGWIDVASISDAAPEGAAPVLDGGLDLNLPPIEFNVPD